MSRNSKIRKTATGLVFLLNPRFFRLADSPAATMGHPDKITPDVIEWILSDEGVVRRWEGFCARLGLDSYKQRIDGDYEPRSVKMTVQLD